MNGLTITFLVLVVFQLAAAVTFLAVYLRGSDWRTPVGRHLAYWAGSAGALDLSWLLLLAARWQWLMFVLFAAQFLVGAVGWQRVWLVLKTRR